MYESDVSFFCCPETGNPLVISSIERRDNDGEILEGVLEEKSTGKTYNITKLRLMTLMFFISRKWFLGGPVNT